MAGTNNLNGPRIADNQTSGQHRTANEAVSVVDAALTKSVDIDVTDTNAYLLTAPELRSGQHFIIGEGATSPDADVTITLPASIKRGLTYWRNTLTFPVTIQKTGGQSEEAPVIAANSATLIDYDGSNARLAVTASDGGVPETSGTDYKDSVRVRVTSVTLAAPGATLDGETMASGDSFFLDNGLATAGIYDWNGAATPATRRADADTDAEVTSGMIITVVEGTYAGKFYQLETLDPITLDTTPLEFIEVTPAGAARMTNLVIPYSSFTADNLDVIAGYQNRILVINNASNNVTISVPADLMSNNSRFGVFRLGAGTVTLVADGTTIYSSGSVLLVPRYCTAMLQRRASTIWHQLYPLIDASAAGGGDLLAANNLSDVASASTARSNLGLEIGVDVQAHSANLDEFATVNPSAAGLDLLDDATAADQRTTLSAAARAQTDTLNGFIETVSDKTITVWQNVPFAIDVTKITTICASGTCTLTGKIGATALGGTANSVTSSQQEQAHASANSVSIGDDLKITISSNSSCLDLAFTIEFTRTLA